MKWGHRKMKKKVIKILNIVVDVVVIMILILSVLVLTVSLSSNSEGVPDIFGKAPMRVLSDSMEPELHVNDLLICDTVTDPNAEYSVGEIVTFQQEINGNLELNTHRIVEIVNRDGEPYKAKDGEKYYRTKGDNNANPDELLKTSDEIKAVYHGVKIPWVGYLKTQEGFFFFVLLPMIIFFLYEAVRVVINIVAYSKEKAILQAQEVINSADLTEEQKKRAIEEYLAAQNGSQEKSDEDGTEPAEESITSDEEKSEES